MCNYSHLCLSSCLVSDPQRLAKIFIFSQIFGDRGRSFYTASVTAVFSFYIYPLDLVYSM